MPPRRMPIGPVAFLPQLGFVAVPVLPPYVLPDGTTARGALVGRLDGRLVAYANVCRHLAISLDLGDGNVMDDDRVHLRCHHHGAVFEPSAGRCVVGPCHGRQLWPWTLEQDADGQAWLLVGSEPDDEDF